MVIQVCFGSIGYSLSDNKHIHSRTYNPAVNILHVTSFQRGYEVEITLQLRLTSILIHPAGTTTFFQRRNEIEKWQTDVETTLKKGFNVIIST